MNSTEIYTGKKVLIVDDDTRNIFALKAILKAKKYDCVSAAGAGEAIEMIRKDKDIRIVLMDMMMPDMDGYEALGVIRNDEELKSMPVVAVTAQAMVGDKEKCLEAGADAYLSKPVDVDALIVLLNKYLM
jgi:two-component system cell cycle response regulator DivK